MQQDDRSRRAEEYLQHEEIHTRWAAGYRTAENDAFYEHAFDALQRVVPAGAAVLDVGCGTGEHTLRLSKRGHPVYAMDLALAALARARLAVQRRHAGAPVRFLAGNVLRLPFRDDAFPVVLVWGVLMHIPQMPQAWSELGRVLQGGGVLIVSEANRGSVQSLALRALRRIVPNRSAAPVRTPYGDEYWVERPDGALVSREADIASHVRLGAAAGLTLEQRRAGQFTEIYTRLPWRPARRVAHALNRVWFERVRWPAPAFSNILVFRKGANVARR